MDLFISVLVVTLAVVVGFFGLRLAVGLIGAYKVQRDVASLDAAVRRVHTAQLVKKAAKKS